VKDYTEVSISKDNKKKIQTLAACQKTSDDKAFEQVIRYGLEAYFAEQAARADTAIVQWSLASSDNENGI
jgi:hypothetical protein